MSCSGASPSALPAGARRRIGDRLHLLGRPPDAPDHIFPDLPERSPTHAYAAFCGLAQGDGWAVDIAQSGHLALARSGGFLLPGELVEGRAPFPDSDVVGALCIDDCAAHERRPQWDRGSPGSAARLLRARDAVVNHGATEARDKAQIGLEDLPAAGGCDSKML